ncbi:DUF3276 family protein [Breznakiellaceae bacterium SP9]
MGIRGEIFSTRVLLPNRTYFFNVKENRVGDLYLNIVESKNKDEGGFERQSVVLFEEDLQDFLKGFEESLKIMEKAAREKAKAARNGTVQPSTAGSAETTERPDAQHKRRYHSSPDGNGREQPAGSDAGTHGNYEGRRHQASGGNRDDPKEHGRRVIVRRGPK